MTSQCGPRRLNLSETKMRHRYDVICRVGLFQLPSGEFPFAMSLFSKRLDLKISFLQKQITELYWLFSDL